MEDKCKKQFQIYRKTTLGETLIETLDAFIDKRHFEDNIKDMYLEEFDKAICEMFGWNKEFSAV